MSSEMATGCDSRGTNKPSHIDEKPFGSYVIVQLKYIPLNMECLFSHETTVCCLVLFEKVFSKKRKSIS